MTDEVSLNANVQNQQMSDRMFLIQNATTMRSDLLNKMLDPRRDIDEEAGYPKTITPEQFKYLYEREGVGRRVVNLYPNESWKVDPIISDDEEAEESIFEKAWNDLQDKKNIIHHLHRIDVLSGIGCFGILYIGFNDGKKPEEALDVIDQKGNKVGDRKLELLFLRPFDESLVDVASIETDESNPRFGLPTMYNVQMIDIVKNKGISGDRTSFQIHWTRVLHVADMRDSDEIYGTPRMRSVYNRVYDLRKVMAGSGEMFWKGGFPGYSFEMNPDVAGDAEIDMVGLKKEIDQYSNGLQRYLALTGVTAKSLAPQVADPTAHVDANYKYIAISIEVPLRIFTGSESAQLASGQDKETWNDRVMHRQNKYLTPLVIRGLIDRFILTGVLPEPKDETYNVTWPDLNTMTDEDKAIVSVKRTEALAKYVQADIEAIIPVDLFLKIIMNFEPDQVKVIIDGAQNQLDEDRVDENNLDLEEDME